MKIKEHQKLVRDRIPDIVRANGEIPTTRILTEDTHFSAALRHKIVEEGREVIGAITREELVGELADLEEVLCELCVHHGILRNELRVVKQKKRQERGGFKKRIFLESVETPDKEEGRP